MSKRESSTQFQMADTKTQVQETLGEALVFTMLCIVGLQVEVQVKDGSVYSGIFHSANFSHGVVLKKARKIGEGKRGTNVPLESFLDTLVILSQDFVQLIVKDFALTSEGQMNNTNMKEGTLNKSLANSNQVENKSRISKEKVSRSDVKVSSCNDAPSMNGTAQNKTIVKESKLNPSARAFSPSIAKPTPMTTVVPPIANSFTVPNIKTAGTPPNGAYNIVPHHPFVSDKPFLYNNFPPANAGVAPAYPQQILGCQATNVYPVGVASQYRPVQFAPTFMNPNAPAVMAARAGPTMCMHPIPQVGIQGAPVVPQAWPRTMFNPYPPNVPRFQGVSPVCMTSPPIMNMGSQMVIPGPMPIAPTLRPVQPFMVPTGASTFPMKF
ncbi:uncharacterized protein LOC144569339 isoform X1 [Carex rostrata]